MAQINVIAFGGLGGNLFSAGLKTILMRLNGIKEIDFKTYDNFGSWKPWGSTLKTWRDPTVMIGHSFGVTAAFGAIRLMGDAGPKVPLVIALDASQWWWMQPSLIGSGGNVVPPRVERCIHLYTRGGIIGNQRLVRPDGTDTRIENTLEPGAHSALEDREAVQKRCVDQIKSVASNLNPPKPKAA